MIKFKTIGVLLRDSTQEYPLQYLKSQFEPLGAKISVLDENRPVRKLDLIIAMGGDGTVLRALDMQPNCPVLAINYGAVGFLTAGDRDDLEVLLQRLVKNDYVLSERILLRCDYQRKTVHAVNEVFLRSSGRMIQVDVFVNGAKIRTIRGDGVIVGTPTGSTGYLLSTGAPLVMPDANCFILDGINEYNFSSRALVLSMDAKIRLHVASLHPDQEALLVVDGTQLASLKAGQELSLRCSERKAQMIFFDKNYFFHNLSSRLSWY
ncbi:MAG: NAD(+)/NADH kinase [SAR324 cluster bacterium]|nr:NAD(+)/NADH kinase [SAR324 cluster bacterium]MCZ6647599.1 NAD(+)/NADH kinase [SAR324 cluster bacterium]MCZ6729513.1 NAD(+)/NADH kinase [SAR324 cluster bacterium]